MIPLFKSHFSIGKSILKLSGDNGIFSIAKDLKLKKLFLVEDSLTGFLEAAKLSKEQGIQLVFGLRLSVCDSKDSDQPDCHKIIILSKNDQGCKLLNKIYSLAFTSENCNLALQDLKSVWNEEALCLAIPFYDSFIHNNCLQFSTCMPNFNFTKPVFFKENNGLPFDSVVQSQLKTFCKKKGYEIIDTKSIYYEKKSDFKAYQTYKLICNRSGWKGKSSSIECPNIDHCGSDEFCLESFLKNEKRTA
jgi:DNA polymerase III alpha subunit